MTQNIALTGLMRAGKDAAAKYLSERYGYTRFAFGDELKRYAHELFDVNPASKPRELLQWFGQTVRERDSDVWVRKCFRRIAWSDEGGPYVITDLRQPNEFVRCRAEGYVIIRVNAPDWLRRQRALAAGDIFEESALKHDTESHVDTFAVDYDVYNTGTLDGLYAQIDAIMADIEVSG